MHSTSYLFGIFILLFTLSTNVNAQQAADKSKQQVKDSIEYYPGDVKTRGKYINGLKDGVFEYYSEYKYPNFDGRSTRRLDSTVTYRIGKRNGIKTTYQQYYFEEVVRATESYVDDKLDGNSIFWHSTIQVETVKTFKKGKFINKVKYSIDTTLWGMYVQIQSFPDDTIFLNKYTPGDSLRIKVIGYNDPHLSNGEFITTSLSDRGYKVKSFVIDRFAISDQMQTFSGDLFIIPRLRAGDWFYITDLKILDPNGFEFRLPGRKILVR